MPEENSVLQEQIVNLETVSEQPPEQPLIGLRGHRLRRLRRGSAGEGHLLQPVLPALPHKQAVHGEFRDHRRAKQSAHDGAAAVIIRDKSALEGAARPGEATAQPASAG